MSSKERVKRYRERQKALQTKVKEGENVTVNVTPPIVPALVDPIKRKKLEKISQSLKDFGLLGEVRYGVYGPTFEIVADLLEVTR